LRLAPIVFLIQRSVARQPRRGHWPTWRRRGVKTMRHIAAGVSQGSCAPAGPELKWRLKCLYTAASHELRVWNPRGIHGAMPCDAANTSATLQRRFAGLLRGVVHRGCHSRPVVLVQVLGESRSNLLPRLGVRTVARDCLPLPAAIEPRRKRLPVGHGGNLRL
jgi:hypothetical protein